MSSLSTACPQCQRQLVFPDHSVVGRTARCPGCDHRFTIEAPVNEGLPDIQISDSPVVSRHRGRKSTRRTVEQRPDRAVTKRPAWLPLAISGGLGVIAVALLLVVGGGDGGNDDPEIVEDAVTADAGRAADESPAAVLPAAAQATGTIRVETTPPGATVLVDDQKVRDADGALQVTPCVVTAAKGPHAVTVVRKGYQDQTRQVTVAAKEKDVVFSAPRAGTSVLLATGWFSDSRVGQPVPIEAINAVGRSRDPWLSSDGLSLWFVADGSEGQGVYYATRPSSFSEFDDPQFVPITRGRDHRASPSVSAKGLLVYVVPEKAAIWGASRGGPLSPFDDKRALASSRKTTPRWTAAQVLGGGLHLFWVESVGESASCFHASRAEVEKAFGPAKAFELPGTRPCLSADGLRQYTFDGKTLVRWRRSSLRGRFASDDTVAELELPDYVDDPRARQFTVSDDERWMVYCEAPGDAARLLVVRLHERPHRGILVVGVPAPPRPVVAKVDKKKLKPRTPASKLVIDPKAVAKATKDEPKPDPKPVKIPELPLTAYRSSWYDMLAKRNYTGAAKHLAAAKKDQKLTGWSEQLEWDSNELSLIQEFWKDARRVVAAMKPDDPVRIGSVRLKFVKFQDDVLVVQGKAKPIEKPLAMMAASDLVGLVEATLDADDSPARLRLGVFLYRDLKGRGTSAIRRLRRAGEAGAEFLDRRGLRLLAEARGEIARGRPERALPLLATIEKSHAKTSAAKRLPAVWEQLYSLKKWSQQGARQWQTKGVAWRAAPGRSAGSLVVSPREMKRFELSLEWKTEGETGQGGVFFRYGGTGNPVGGSLKLQLSSDAGVAADQFSTGALFGVAPPSANLAKPTGEWNSLKLRVDGDVVKVEINGQQVLMTTVADPDLPAVGHVALDGIAGGITYRRVLLVPLASR